MRDMERKMGWRVCEERLSPRATAGMSDSQRKEGWKKAASVLLVVLALSGCNPKSVKEWFKDWRGQVQPPPGDAKVEDYIPSSFSVSLTQIGEPKPMSNVAGTYITDDYGKIVVEYQLSGQTGQPIRIYAIKFGTETLAKGYWNKFRDNIQGDASKEKYRGYTTKNGYLYYEHTSKNYAMVARFIGVSFYAIEVPRTYPDYEKTAMAIDADMLAHFKALAQRSQSAPSSETSPIGG
jgi:hypothetical protein